MSERIYTWLLRLYPSRFQKSYGREALQLLRDRARDERGFASRLRLWLDILSDLAISVPQSYRRVAGSVATHCYDGGPSFLSLEDETLNPGSLFYGVLASIVIYAVVLVLVGHAGASLPIQYSSSSQPSSYSEASAGSGSSAGEVPNYSGTIAKPVARVSPPYTPLPPSSGSNVNLTAKVIGFGNTPTLIDTIRFFDGDVLVGFGTLSDGAVLLTGKPPDLPHDFLRAAYAGDENYSGAASAGGRHVASLPQSSRTGGPTRGTLKPLTFEVVSIHEDKSGAGFDDVTTSVTPDGFRARNVPLLSLIQGAYRPSEGSMSFRLKQIVGLPTWAMFQIRYDVDARVSEGDLPAWKNPALQPEMLQTMMQAMLADRFKLQAHRETKVVPIYNLTVGSKRPKLTPYNGATLTEIQQKHPGAFALSGGVIAASGPNPGQQSFFGVTVSQLGTLLSNLAGRPVLDKTGLEGRYDASYQIELLPPPPPRTDGAVPPPPSPDSDFFRSQISTIVQDQLGLRLKPGTGPVESLVIDHVEQLSEN